MNIDGIITALDLPADARVDQRVPKKLLVENGAPTAADKRWINDDIEEVRWLYALKPITIGVPEFRDTVREYLEIAVVSVTLRSVARTSRIAELVHRAIPYPVLLIASHDGSCVLSLAHKRWSQGEAGATVLDGDMITAELGEAHDIGFLEPFVRALSLVRQPRINLHVLYQGWMDVVLALFAARVTGKFVRAASPERAEARRDALTECSRCEKQIDFLRAAAAKEKQVARQVEINLELKRIQAEYSAARAKL